MKLLSSHFLCIVTLLFITCEAKLEYLCENGDDTSIHYRDLLTETSMRSERISNTSATVRLLVKRSQGPFNGIHDIHKPEQADSNINSLDEGINKYINEVRNIISSKQLMSSLSNKSVQQDTVVYLKHPSIKKMLHNFDMSILSFPPAFNYELPIQQKPNNLLTRAINLVDFREDLKKPINLVNLSNCNNDVTSDFRTADDLPKRVKENIKHLEHTSLFSLITTTGYIFGSSRTARAHTNFVNAKDKLNAERCNPRLKTKHVMKSNESNIDENEKCEIDVHSSSRSHNINSTELVCKQLQGMLKNSSLSLNGSSKLNNEQLAKLLNIPVKNLTDFINRINFSLTNEYILNKDNPGLQEESITSTLGTTVKSSAEKMPSKALA